jgi:hypothetical protein
MKTYIKNTLILFIAAIFMVSCDDEVLTVLNPNVSSTVSVDKNDVVLLPDNAGATALTISWSEPDFGYNAGAIYKVTLSANGNSNTQSAGTSLSKVYETVQLNKLLLGLGLSSGAPTQVDVKITVELSDYHSFVSNTTSFMATVYEDKLDLSTEWGVVGSAYNDWGASPDAPFWTTSNPDVIVAYVTLMTGEMKFRTNNSWDYNFGDDGNDGTLEQNGANIAVTAGTYKITLNTSTFTYTIEAYSWGLVGSATPNGWDGPDMKMEYDSYSDTWKAVVTLAAGEVKFRFNNDWGLNYGDNGADGSLENGGANIAVNAGNYLVTLDLSNLEYSIEPIDIWGIVGSAAPNGWDGPNVKFTPDFGTDGVWVLNSVTLTDGEIKFRTNDSWDYNFGDDGNNGTLEQNGANIPVTAGTYKIVLDFSDPNAPTYTKTAI